MCIRLCVYTHVCGPAHVKFCIWLLGNGQDQVCLGKNSRKPWKPSLICPHGEKRPEPWGGLSKQVGGSVGDPSGHFPVPILRVHQDREAGSEEAREADPLVSPPTPLREACHTHPLGLESGAWMSQL